MIRQLFLFLFKIKHLPILFPATISTWETESRVNVRWLFQHCEAFSFHLYYFSFFRTVCLTDLWKEAGLNDGCVVFLLNICQSCVICNSWFSNKRWQGNEWVGLCWLCMALWSSSTFVFVSYVAEIVSDSIPCDKSFTQGVGALNKVFVRGDSASNPLYIFFTEKVSLSYIF